MAHTPVSLIFTTYNESASLPLLLASISAQTVLPNEVVVCDAGSSDDTAAQLKAWGVASGIPTTLVTEKGANISRGRNVAIRQAKYSIIAVTDGGCELNSIWLAAITKPFAQKDINLVYGLTRPVGVSVVGRTYAALYDASARSAEMDETELSSRTVAFRKDAWYKVGGYPEDLTLAGEDTLFFWNFTNTTSLHLPRKPRSPGGTAQRRCAASIKCTNAIALVVVKLAYFWGSTLHWLESTGYLCCVWLPEW